MRTLRILATTGALLALAGPAHALILTDDTVTAASTDDGFAAQVTVWNSGDAGLPLPGVWPITDTCTVTTETVLLDPHAGTDVDLAIPSACFADGVDQLRLDLGVGGMPTVTISAPQAAPTAWAPLGYGAGVALAAAALVAAFGLTRVSAARLVAPDPGDEPTDADLPESKGYQAVTALISGKFAELGYHGTQWRPLREGRLGLGEAVPGLDPAWSVKDSLVATSTVGFSAILALVTSTDLLAALLGETPDLVPITIAALVAGAIVGTSAAVVKLLGATSAEVTAGALVLSSSLVALAYTWLGATVAFASWPLLAASGTAVQVGLIVLIAVAETTLLALTIRGMSEALGTRVAALPQIPADAGTAWDAGSPWEREHRAGVLARTYATWIQTPPTRGTITMAALEMADAAGPPELPAAIQRRSALP